MVASKRVPKDAIVVPGPLATRPDPTNLPDNFVYLTDEGEIYRVLQSAWIVQDQVSRNLAVQKNGIYAASTTTQLASRVTGDSVDRVTLDASGTFSWSSGALAADVTLGRGAANRLDSSGDITARSANGGLTRIGAVGPSGAAGVLFALGGDAAIYRASANNLRTANNLTVDGSLAVGTTITASNGYLQLPAGTTLATGGIAWGTDTSLFRSAANQLKTPGAIVANSFYIGTGGVAFYDAAVASYMLYDGSATGYNNSLVATTAARIPLAVTAKAAQTADLQQWLSSAPAVLFAIDANGFPKWTAAKAQTTVGAAGGASALPATPTKYLQVKDSTGTTLVVPAYAAA